MNRYINTTTTYTVMSIGDLGYPEKSRVKNFLSKRFGIFSSLWISIQISGIYITVIQFFGFLSFEILYIIYKQFALFSKLQIFYYLLTIRVKAILLESHLSRYSAQKILTNQSQYLSKSDATSKTYCQNRRYFLQPLSADCFNF